MGRCPECGKWNSLHESASSVGPDRAGEAFPLPLESIEAASDIRIATGSAEIDRVLGGGILRGSAILLGGEPGIGKSTLLLQLCARTHTKGRVLYVSGEESPSQIKLRAERLALSRKGLEVLSTGDLGRIRTALDAVKPALAIVDSMQTLRSEEAGQVAGTPNQIKHCTQELVSWAKNHDAAVVLVAHITKDGFIAGPKTAEHLVDVVLGFEQGDGDIRTLRASKNRFGSSDEIGLFRMTAGGLVEVSDPSHLFLVRREGVFPAGVAVSPVHEGSRVLLVEIQSLVVPAKGGLTRVYSDRIDVARVSRIAAVLEKRTGIRFSDQDIYVNVAGGMRLTEPGMDLALACALFSARSGTPVPAGTALVGELSLAGEIRPVVHLRRRSRAAWSLGFGRTVGPLAVLDEGKSAAEPGRHEDEGGWSGVSDIGDALRLLWGDMQSGVKSKRTGGGVPEGIQG